MSKYLSHKTVVDGITFDSKDEAKYYEALKIRKYRGEIQNFELQPKFTLIQGFKKNGKTVIYHNDNSEEYIDVKGMTTQQGELRIKLFNHFYRDLKLSIVARNLKYGDEYGFIDYYELQKIRRRNRRG